MASKKNKKLPRRNKKIKIVKNKVEVTALSGTIRNIQQQFGLNENTLNIVDTLEDLKNESPNIVIAKCLHDCHFKQNDFSMQTLKRKYNYVMSISTYKILEYDQYKNDKNGKARKNLEPAKLSFIDLYRAYNGEDLTNKRLLVTRTGGIGDLLFILPNLIYLKNKYKCKIVFATSPQYHSMVEEWGCVDKVISLPFSDIELKNSQYHLIFEGVIERTNEAKKVNAYNLFSKWMGLNLPDEYLHPVQKANVNTKEKVKNILYNIFKVDKDDLLCAIQLRASSPIRTPHPQTFWLPVIRTIISRGFKIIITDNPHVNKQITDVINNFFPMYKDSIINFTEYSESISYSIALAEIVDVVVGTDSSLIHIAESVGTKNLSIYGPFPASVRVSNYKYGVSINCHKEECTPCFTHGHKPCIYGGMNDSCSPCYNNIDMSEFKNKFIKLVDR